MNEEDGMWKIAIPKAFWEPHPLFYARGVSHSVESTVPKLPWRTRLLYRWRTLATILRYLVTGYCGYGGCGYATLYYYWEHCRRCDRREMCCYSGKRARPLVPEAGCPVHDTDTRLSRWAQKARRGREWSPWQIQKRRLPDD